MNNKLLLDNLRCIPDWPIKGVNFRDVTTLFKNHAVSLCPLPSPFAWVQESFFAENRENFLVKPYKKVTPRNMALTPSKSTKMPSTKTTLCYFTTTFLPPEEP